MSGAQFYCVKWIEHQAFFYNRTTFWYDWKKWWKHNKVENKQIKILIGGYSLPCTMGENPCTVMWEPMYSCDEIYLTTCEPLHDRTNKMACAPSIDSDQPGHLPSLIRVFAVRMMKAWTLSYPLSAQQRLWSDWADAQADLSVHWAHIHFVGFCSGLIMSGTQFYRVKWIEHQAFFYSRFDWKNDEKIIKQKTNKSRF